MSTTFQTDLFEQLSSQNPSSQYHLLPINTLFLLDKNDNILDTINDVTATYSSGTITVTADYTAQFTGSVASVGIGSVYNGQTRIYFISKLKAPVQLTQGVTYTVSGTVNLANFSLNTSPFPSATVSMRLIDIIGGILTGNPLYAGKTGQLFSTIYVINNTQHTVQSFKIPVSILMLENGVMTIGGIVPSTVKGNQISVRNANQESLIQINGNTVITFKKGRTIAIELSF